MEDTEFSKGETILIGIICTVIFVVISGLIFAPDLFWDDFVKIYIWDPIVKDAGSSGDAGYSGVNTAVYSRNGFIRHCSASLVQKMAIAY